MITAPIRTLAQQQPGKGKVTMNKQAPNLQPRGLVHVQVTGRGDIGLIRCLGGLQGFAGNARDTSMRPSENNKNSVDAIVMQ